MALRHAVRILGLSGLLVLLGGCGSAGRIVAVPFDVARHVAVESAKLPIDAAQIGAKGLTNAVFK